MAWVTKTDNGRWKGRYRTMAGRTRSRTFDRKADAERWLRSELSRRDRGAWVDPAFGKVRFDEWAARMMASRAHLRESTRVRDVTVLQSLVLPQFGTATLSSIAPDDVRAWVSELTAAGYASSTVAKAYQLLSVVMSAAVNDGLIASSPCRGVKLPRLEEDAPRALTAKKMHRLADTIDPHHRVLILTAAFTGLRFGELAALRVANLDLLRSRLTVSHTLSEVQGVIIEGPPKTKASLRTLTLSATIVDELARHLAGGTDPDRYVFLAPSGGPLRRSNFRHRVWLPAVKAAGLEGFTFHGLRHTAATLMVSSGVHPRVIAARLGHSSVRTVLDVYTRSTPDLDEAAAAALDDVLTRPTAPSPRPEAVGEVIHLDS